MSPSNPLEAPAYPWFPAGDDCAYCESDATWFVGDVYYQKKIGAHACDQHLTNAFLDAKSVGIDMASVGITVFEYPACKGIIATTS